MGVGDVGHRDASDDWDGKYCIDKSYSEGKVEVEGSGISKIGVDGDYGGGDGDGKGEMEDGGDCGSARDDGNGDYSGGDVHDGDSEDNYGAGNGGNGGLDDDEDNDGESTGISRNGSVEPDLCSSTETEILSCLALNVCGIRSKLLYPELLELVSKHDIICISETKLAGTDTVDVDGYKDFIGTGISINTNLEVL